MRTQLLITVLLFFTSLSFAQLGLSSFDVPVDAKSISMGESFVAVNDPLSSLMYNPASYNPNSGLSVSYSQRRANLVNDMNQFMYYNASVSYNSPIGEFAFLYNRLDWGTYDITAGSPAISGKTHLYDHLFLVKYSYPIADNLTCGVAIKTYNIIEVLTAGYSSAPMLETTSLPVLVDIGALYSKSLLPSDQDVKDKLTFGLSIQNYGSDFRQKGDLAIEFVRLPRYARIGFSYLLSTSPDKQSSPSILGVQISGEYRNLLNPLPSQGSERDYWGFGSELTVYELLSLRIGGDIMPYTGAYGNKGVPSVRYGVGIKFPFKYLGVNTPLRLHVGYAGIPLNSLVDYSFENAKATLQVFSLGVDYPLNNSNQ